jgi:hypothetical protein
MVADQPGRVGGPKVGVPNGDEGGRRGPSCSCQSGRNGTGPLAEVYQLRQGITDTGIPMAKYHHRRAEV